MYFVFKYSFVVWDIFMLNVRIGEVWEVTGVYGMFYIVYVFDENWSKYLLLEIGKIN